MALADAGCDVVVIDTAHGHSASVAEVVERIKRENNRLQIIAGNVATYDATRALIDAGADAVKVGIGPGSICTTRIVAGVGVPQLTAVMDSARAAKGTGASVIADGGIKYSGDLAKAIAAGANVAMMGSMFAGTDESPGEVFLYQGPVLQVVSRHGFGRGDGAWIGGSVFPEGSLVREAGARGHRGPDRLQGADQPGAAPVGRGLRASMGYVGGANIAEFQNRARFVRITGAGLRESHVHDVMITREAPNYRQG